MRTQNRLFSRRELFRKAGEAAAVAALTATFRGAYPQTRYSLPGLYPGLVIGIKHSAASVKMAYQTEPIQDMVRSGLKELTGAPDPATGWKQLFGPEDVVGIKVNPNGIEQIVSSPAVMHEIIRGLQSAGVAPGNIIFYERYRNLFNRISGWLPDSVKQDSAAWDYSGDQTGLTYNPSNLPGITGYNRDFYVDCPGFLMPGYSPKNPAQTRSYLANAVTKFTKIISVGVLKDHQAAGFTLGLKNLCQGMVNNVNRAHPDVTGPGNFMNQFIPLVVGQPWIRNKVVLSIVDGTHGLWDAGPTGNPRFVWEHNTMYFATDMVACDTIASKAIDAQRVLAGLPTEAESGADQWDKYHFRQPDHIAKAGQAGLGAWQSEQIHYRAVTIG
ncbi:MAG TPA: DUF362 domain-containing protein [Bryobacteraceae bacterium]|nr:DUF362 domain-containing protein [Bryobacteraceae bacterium]